MVLLLVLLDLHHFQILNVFLNLFLVRVGKELDFQRTIGEINLLVVHTVEIFFKRLTPWAIFDTSYEDANMDHTTQHLFSFWIFDSALDPQGRLT